MKKLCSLLIAMMFFGLTVDAQSDDDIIAAKLLQKCKNELEDIAKKKVAIKDICFNTDGHWLILFGDFGYSFSYVPTSLENLLVDLNGKQTQIKQALMSGDSWLLLYDQNKYTSQDFSSAVTEVLDKCKARNSILTGIFTGPENEILGLYGTNGFVARNCPEKQLAKINDVNKKHRKLRNAAFGNNCWVLLYGNNGFCFQDLPSDLQDFMKKSINKKLTINLVRIFKDKWFVVYDDYKFATNVD
ncbi:MAG: hypothetical protein IKQ46_09095 [Bacteroidales bacterium]|nr:hypothetical protein [Bacteroidales bacterium]